MLDKGAWHAFELICWEFPLYIVSQCPDRTFGFTWRTETRDYSLWGLFFIAYLAAEIKGNI